MSAIVTLRLALTARGIDHRDIGRQTFWGHDGMAWCAEEGWDGRLTLKAGLSPTPRQVLRAAANVSDIVHESSDHVAGHSSCSACGASVGPYDRYCHECGALLRSSWREG